MKPSDEEVKEDTEEQEAEVIEVEQDVVEERVVRHAEKNDSYRESPDLEEEIVQPPLDPPEKYESEDSVPVAEEQMEQTKERVEEENLMATPETPLVVADTREEVTPVSHMSQHDIEPEGVPHGKEVEVIKQLSPELSFVPQAAPPSPQSTVYHTISGGPETLSETSSLHKKVEEKADQSNPGTDYTKATSGYTIPDPTYVAPERIPESQSHFVIVLFLCILLIIAAGAGYVYFSMPEVFSELFSAMMIVKDQIFNK